MSKLHIPGGTLHYTTYGAGYPMCLTHQYQAVSGKGYLPDAIQPFFTCYALDARGLRGSGPVRTPEDLTMVALADDLEAARRALGIERWVVGGTSTGGMVALVYARRYPDAISGLILCSTAASYRYYFGSIYNPENSQGAIYANAEHLVRTGNLSERIRAAETIWSLTVADPMRTPFPGPHASDPPLRKLGMLVRSFPTLLHNLTSSSTQRLKAFIENSSTFDLEDELEQITVPTLVIVGRHDRCCPIENSERIAHSIPGARLVVCEQSGHLPFLEEPNIVRNAIHEFVLEHGFA